MAVDKRRYNSFAFVENTICNSPKVPRAKFLGSHRLFCFISLCKFGSFKNSFATITSFLDSEDSLRWYKRKKWFLWTMTAAQAAQKYVDEWGLTWYLLWGIYTSIPTWTQSQNSLAAAGELKNIPLWNISQMITMTVPIRKNRKYTVKTKYDWLKMRNSSLFLPS